MKEIVCQAKQGQKNAEKLNRAPKRSILGPQNLGLEGAWAPRIPLGSASEMDIVGS